MTKKQHSFDLHDGQTLDSVETYQFEPIKGYPMLHWQGKRPFRSTNYYPAQLREIHGEAVDGWWNKVYWGDNLQVMSHLLREFRGQIQLVYIDPPFDSKAEYKKDVKLRGRVAYSDQTAFEEKQYTDIWTNDEYLQFMYERLILIRELLTPNGSIFLHSDWHKAHQLRCILDEVFGPQNFVNEIIWCYHGPGSPNMKRFNRKHDTIYWYSKGNSWIFNTDDVRVPHDEKTMENFKDGLRGSGFIEGEYEIPEGKVPEDWWIMAIAGRYPKDGIKRVGYPTEKPLKLLERIILATSQPGDIVFDCFMGAGTAQTAAMKLGRRFIGADINLGAVQITTKRLLKAAEELEKEQERVVQPKLTGGELTNENSESSTFYTGFEVYNVNNYDIFRNPLEARDLLMEALEVQPLPDGSVFDGTKDGRMYKLMPVNRIATRADLNDLIANLDYRTFEQRRMENPNRPVEKITLVCMGHEPDLASQLKRELKPYLVDVEVYDILRDGQHLQFKRDSEARVVIEDGYLVIKAFYPMNLLQKLSLQQEEVSDWRELTESVMIDWNYDGAVLTPSLVDIPEKNELVQGRYPVPENAGTIRVKITDLLSESWEGEVSNG